MSRVYNIVLWALVAALAVVMALVVLVPERVEKYMYASVSDVPTTTVAMILGASVRQDWTLSPVLRERADRGIELYMRGKVLKILVTGDNSEVSHNEVNPVGKYMVARGVPKEDIFLDHAGFDT
jgi:SanA protein